MLVGSLFSGVGGLDLGLHRAGFRHAFFCEADEWRRGILGKRWPGVPVYDDVRDVEPPCPRVFLLAGGPPCQPTSYAGKGLGKDDDRWMWPETIRVVRDLRPRWVLLENPSALLARGLEWVVGELAAIGYDCEWDCVPAAALGAPHIRDRVFLLAYPHEERRDGRPRVFGASRWHESPHGCPILQDSDRLAVGARWEWRRAPQASGPEWWPAEPDVGRVAYGVPERLDRLAALGDAVVPQVAEWVGRRIRFWELGPEDGGVGA